MSMRFFLIGLGFCLTLGCASAGKTSRTPASAPAGQIAKEDLDVIAVGECVKDKTVNTMNWGTIISPFGPNDGNYTSYRIAYVVCIKTDKNFKKQVKSKGFDVGFFEDNDAYGISDNLLTQCENFRSDLKLMEVSNKNCG